MSNIIDKIQLSGITYDIGVSGVSVVEVTQAEYDALPSSAKTDTSKMYVITDAEAGDLTQYWTSAQTQSAITEATSGKVDSSSIVSSVTSASTDSEIPTAKAVWDIASQGGGGSSINVVQTTGTSTTDVMSQDAVTTQLNNKANKSSAVGGYKFGITSGVEYLQYTSVNNSNIGNSIYYPSINGKPIFTTNSIYAQNNYNFQLVETSAITTSITSVSTDSQVPSAKAVNDKLGGLSIVKLTQAEYDALATKDSNTLYVIVN